MKNNTRRKMADIVEAFGKINEDIHSAFDTMCENLEKNKNFEEIKKLKKDGYVDSKELLEGSNKWYYINCYGQYKKNIVIGFTFVISVDYDVLKEDASEYEDFLQKLDISLNKGAPMLCILGIYSPASNIESVKIVDEGGWNYVDEIIRLTEGWVDYEENKKNLKYDNWIDVNIEYSDESDDFLESEGWYESAKVKIVPIADIETEERAEQLIDDLLKKASSNGSFNA